MYWPQPPAPARADGESETVRVSATHLSTMLELASEALVRGRMLRGFGEAQQDHKRRLLALTPAVDRLQQHLEERADGEAFDRASQNNVWTGTSACQLIEMGDKAFKVTIGDVDVEDVRGFPFPKDQLAAVRPEEHRAGVQGRATELAAVDPGSQGASEVHDTNPVLAADQVGMPSRHLPRPRVGNGEII